MKVIETDTFGSDARLLPLPDAFSGPRSRAPCRPPFDPWASTFARGIPVRAQVESSVRECCCRQDQRLLICWSKSSVVGFLAALPVRLFAFQFPVLGTRFPSNFFQRPPTPPNWHRPLWSRQRSLPVV